MDEIEYKLDTNNSVLVVNAIDKLISAIKSKFKPTERQRFVVENEELKFLREKCSSKDRMVSLTACQGLLALVELGVLEIGHTMSTVITLLPSAHNYSAIISTMAGLLTLDLRSRLIPGQLYTCQFGLRSPQHPLVTVLEQNKGSEDEVLAQMHALCTHPDYTISSNSLELLRPVFLWLACEGTQHEAGARPWQLLLSLPHSTAQTDLLLACLTCHQICNPSQCERALACYCAVGDAAVYQQKKDLVMALLPMLARISTELVKNGRDPRACYSLIERCFALDAPELKSVAGLTVMLLAENLVHSSALYLLELFNLCLNVITKYEYSTISLNTFAALSLQWLHLPSYLTSSALKIASKILDIHENDFREDRLHMPNLMANKTFQSLLYTDGHLSTVFKLNQIWERIRDYPDKLKSWLRDLENVQDSLVIEWLPFLFGVILEKRKDPWYEDITVQAINSVSTLVNTKKEVSVQVLPVLLYKIANDTSPKVKMNCLKALPLMAKAKVNVPTIVAILNKLRSNKGVPTSFLIMLYTRLAETQVRCFPYLQELLVDPGVGRADDLKWEFDIARAIAVRRICEIRATSHGLELVSVISSILNKCTDRPGAAACSIALEALAHLWRAGAVAPPSTWRALEPKLGRDSRPNVQISLCNLLSEIPSLRVSTADYDKLISDTARKLWSYVAESNQPEVVEAACDALAGYRIEDYTLSDVPEVYRRTVKLPASFCKTPADAARRPEDVLDYIPCEIWPEVFKYTNQAALSGVQRFLTRLVEREIKGYRSGVYQRDARHEPDNLNYLPPYSVVRGLLETFRKQATSPSYDFPDTVLLSIIDVLTSEYPRPLPPLDLCFLHELYHRGALWKPACVKLAARQAQTSASARRFLENYLQGIAPETSDDSDILLVFELLPILCRGMPPNSLRDPIQKCLSHSFNIIASIKNKDVNNLKYIESNTKVVKKKEVRKNSEEVGKNSEEVGKIPEEANKNSESTKYMFIKQLEMIKECLECEKIHDANRTLLSQIVENYFSVISDDNVAWPAYAQTCRCLSTPYLERLTSPAAWWEPSAELARKAGAVRCAVAAAAPLVWLNDVIDAHAQLVADQEYSLRCIMLALKAAPPDDKSTIDWFLQLMARTQVAFKETEDESVKLYLCDVFMLSIAIFSGHWVLEDTHQLTGKRSVRQTLLPAASASLLARGAWADCTLQMLEWLSYTRGATRDAATAQCCQRALLALRHTQPFNQQKIWKRLDFGKTICNLDD
ncbi:focadhesin isoform X2 [Hyposmocoma kahamanoa]|uniref:focadhesin isoform X2 n=1 Tax=Hyposmocoma kahamanoa TaxID=1477025 RepID=UPI000E6D741A|nr:focadhesin isoform X2 [Hyposmocoma kahamanoa]